jgi:predicted flap endonuclease-1-like 5' DNA nuclease
MAPEDPPVPTEYPPSIGRTARRALALDGYTTYAQLTRVTAADLLRIHGVGPKAIRILEDELRARGQAFRT